MDINDWYLGDLFCEFHVQGFVLLRFKHFKCSPTLVALKRFLNKSKVAFCGSYCLQVFLAASLVLTVRVLIWQNKELCSCWKSWVQWHQQLIFGHSRHLLWPNKQTTSRCKFIIEVQVLSNQLPVHKVKCGPKANRFDINLIWNPQWLSLQIHKEDKGSSLLYYRIQI